jgi:hypothetical protein
VKKGDNGRMLVTALLVGPPCLQRAAGYVKNLGGLTLGEAAGLQIVVLLTELGACNAIPALVAILIATLLVVDDSSHSYLLLLKPLSS